MGTVSWFEGRYADSREQCERALEIAESLGSLPMIFAAKFMLASALWGTADMQRAIALQYELRETFSGKLETARLGAIAIPGSMVRSYLSWFMMEVGRYEEGLAHVEQALEIAMREGEPYSEMLARNGMGRNLLKLKRHREAAACLEVAISLIEQYGYDAIRPHVTGQLASALAGIGEASRAVKMVEAWLARGLEERTGRLELYYLNAGYSEALLRSSEQGKAIAAADRALEIARNLSNPCLIVQGLGLRARLLAEVQPGATAIDRALAEQAELCRRHGLVAEPRT
jgi:tetratricopeptide (TPR) repeat protein